MSSTFANSGGPSSERQIRTAASAAPTAAGTADAVNMNGRDWIRRNSITSAGPAITPPHEASDLENVAIRRSTRSSTPEQLSGPGAASAEHPEGVGLVDHQPAPNRAHRSAISVSGATSPSIENTPSTTTRMPPPVRGRGLEPSLEQIDPIVPERPELGAREDAAVEDRRVVAGVGDHRVARGEDRPQRADVRLMAGGEHERGLSVEPIGELALELEVAARSCR